MSLRLAFVTLKHTEHVTLASNLNINTFKNIPVQLQMWTTPTLTNNVNLYYLLKILNQMYFTIHWWGNCSCGFIWLCLLMSYESCLALTKLYVF